jgi:hypothetical protein
MVFNKELFILASIKLFKENIKMMSGMARIGTI